MFDNLIMDVLLLQRTCTNIEPCWEEVSSQSCDCLYSVNCTDVIDYWNISNLPGSSSVQYMTAEGGGGRVAKAAKGAGVSPISKTRSL